MEPPARKPSKPKPKQGAFSFAGARGGYQPPSISLLDEPLPSEVRIDSESLKMNARLLEKKLQDFGVEGRVTEVHPGPIVTLYEFESAAGVKISRIVSGRILYSRGDGSPPLDLTTVDPNGGYFNMSCELSWITCVINSLWIR